MQVQRELTRASMPVVNPRLFVADEYDKDLLGNLSRRGGRMLQQPRQDLPHLRHRRRRLFSPSLLAPGSGTTTPTAIAVEFGCVGRANLIHSRR